MGCLSSKRAARANHQGSDETRPLADRRGSEQSRGSNQSKGSNQSRRGNERRQCHLQADKTSSRDKPCPWTSECQRQERAKAAKARNTAASCRPSCCRLPGCSHSKTSLQSRQSHASCTSARSIRSNNERPVSQRNSRNSMCCTCNCKPGAGKKANCKCGKT